MEQTTFSIRMDKDVKRELDRVCADMGITATAAINVFARQMVLERGFPFKPTTRREGDNAEYLKMMERVRMKAIANGTADMSLDEINAEIASARKEGK